jgi:hypothetical protein
MFEEIYLILECPLIHIKLQAKVELSGNQEKVTLL